MRGSSSTVPFFCDHDVTPGRHGHLIGVCTEVRVHVYDIHVHRHVCVNRREMSGPLSPLPPVIAGRLLSCAVQPLRREGRAGGWGWGWAALGGQLAHMGISEWPGGGGTGL